MDTVKKFVKEYDLTRTFMLGAFSGGVFGLLANKAILDVAQTDPRGAVVMILGGLMIATLMNEGGGSLSGQINNKPTHGGIGRLTMLGCAAAMALSI